MTDTSQPNFLLKNFRAIKSHCMANSRVVILKMILDSHGWLPSLL